MFNIIDNSNSICYTINELKYEPLKILKMKNSNILFKLFCLLPIPFAVIGYFFNIYFEKYLDYINLLDYCFRFTMPTDHHMTSPHDFAPLGAVILGFNWVIVLLKASYDKELLDDIKWIVPGYIIVEIIPLTTLPILFVLGIIALLVKFFQLETK